MGAPATSGWAAYGAAGLSVLLSSVAQLLLKLLMRHRVVSWGLVHEPLLWAGFGAYGASAVLWLWVLSRLPLVVAYPLVSLNFVLVTVGAAWVLREPISWSVLSGLALIVGGLLLVVRQA